MSEEKLENRAQALKWRSIVFSLFGLWWLFGALLGAPSLVSIIDSIFVKFDPGLIQETILESYRTLRVYIAIILNPFILFIKWIVVFFPFLNNSPAEYWIDVFVIFSIWASAIAKFSRRYFGIFASILIFTVLEVVFLFCATLGAMLSFENVVLRELSIAVMPVFILCYISIFSRVFLSPMEQFAGNYFNTIIMIMWIPFAVALFALPVIAIFMFLGGITIGAGIFTLFVMTLVISGGAAVDAKTSGDQYVAEFFLVIMGPFLGLLILFIGDWAANLLILFLRT